MERTPTHFRMDTEMREYTKYFAHKRGLNPSEFMRMIIGEKVSALKQSLTKQEIRLVEQRVIDENNNFKKQRENLA